MIGLLSKEYHARQVRPPPCGNSLQSSLKGRSLPSVVQLQMAAFLFSLLVVGHAVGIRTFCSWKLASGALEHFGRST
eukprot:scaffold173183_cov21-Prasinocladus_malaysianus.AAC.1